MKKTLEILNQMVQDCVIEGYAIGGAVAAIHYTEPTETADLDVFVTFPQDKLLVSLDDIYTYLHTKGYKAFEKEGIVIEGLPVQFLPAATPLLLDAYENARDETLLGKKVKIFSFEHLAAIMLATGRPKDRIRLASAWEHPKLNQPKFLKIVKKHSLQEKWNRFYGQILSPPEI